MQDIMWIGYNKMESLLLFYLIRKELGKIAKLFFFMKMALFLDIGRYTGPRDLPDPVDTKTFYFAGFQ